MKTIRIMVFGILAFALAISLGAVAGEVYADDFDGTVAGACDDCAKNAERVNCSLVISPDVVNNNTLFTAQVNYDPPVSGDRTEIFSFRWPSESANFGETTIRIKKFKGSNTISGSFESVAAPSALFISGTFDARVLVLGDVFCMAKTQMTVVNP